MLLKNKDHLLPILPSKIRSIAVIGVAAGPQAIVGEEGPTVYVERFSVPFEALAARAGASIKVSYHDVGVGIRPLPLLQTDVLSPSSGAGHGLAATYYRSGDLSGAPALTRIDPGINVDGLPAAELGPEVRAFGPPKLTWSARWTGTLTPPTTGEYAFSLDGAGTTSLLIDGKDIAHLLKVNFKSTASGTAQFTAGKPVSIVIEHSNNYSVLGSSLHLGWYPPHPDAMNAATEAARSADIAIVFAGEQLGEGMDKTSLDLPGNQDELIEAVAAQNPHTIVVLNTCTPVAMPWLDRVASVLETWYPGQESGKGTAALLFGDADPGGRLPITFPASPGQGPAAHPEEYPGVGGVAHFNEGILVGYRWYDAHQQKPLFPFGFGLSYTDFSFRHLKLTHDGETVNVSVRVKNVGSRQGLDVVQVYVAEPSEADEAPPQLKGFAKGQPETGGREATCDCRTGQVNVRLERERTRVATIGGQV